MPPLPTLTAQEVLRALLRAGFSVHHQRGSHVHLRSLEKPHLRVVVPNHSGDLAPKTLRAIIAQADMTVEEFITSLR